jgi:lambda family phage minor tail protein L
MSQFQSEQQKLDPSAMISLFTIDATSVGGTVMRFVQASQGSGDVKFGGVSYQSIDIEFSGLETSGVGALPTPTMSIANTDMFIQALVNTLGDLNGCIITRIRTFARFLDGQPDADSTAIYGPDVYKVERKAEDSSVQISWELSAAIDQEGKMLPGRPMVRDTCMWRYRAYDAATGNFNYDRVLCPYTGTKYFDEDDKVTTKANDKPSRTVNCCELRFGKGKPWPFGGFPGMGRNT